MAATPGDGSDVTAGPGSAGSNGPTPADSDRHPLVRQVLSGANPALARMAAEGLLPLEPRELVPLQVRLAGSADPEIARVATENLSAQPQPQLAELIREGAPSEVLAYFARRGGPVVQEAVLRRRDISRDLLREMAPGLDANLQEVLLLRQDAIIEQPEILAALESNPRLSRYARRRAAEYRQHLLPRERPAEPDPEEPSDDDGPSQAEIDEALEAARAVEARGDVDEETGLTDFQIRSLPIPVRIKLARTGTRSLRNILVRDPNPQVAVAVFKGPTLADQEVEKIAANRSVIGDVLETISRRREWVSKYKIMSALVHNPRTPVGVAVRLVPRLAVRDLQNLARDRSVSDAVRSTARRLYRMKQR